MKQPGSRWLCGEAEVVNDRCANNLSALLRQPIEMLLSR
jgi:hypothetical protein